MRRFAIAAALVLAVAFVPTAEARNGAKKGIWGPVRVDGVSQFPIYRELGARIYDTSFAWADVATRRPARPRDPADPAYRWPQRLDDAVAEAARFHMRVAIMVKGTPSWANGGKAQNWVPKRLSDFADFMAAAATRYPMVRYWIVWGEPTRWQNFEPLPRHTPWNRPLKPAQRAAPHRYARLLDAAYGAIKHASPRALVVGGNTFSYGDIGPRNWIANLKLPSGRPPRMDLYGHNPFGARRPDLSQPPFYVGAADFSDLDDLARWVDRYLGRRRNGRRINLWIGEYAVPTRPSEFGFYVSERTQASWLASALRITRRDARIAATNWLTLRDTPTSFGLLRSDGSHKPAFAAYRRG